jgi:hypothetical protein
MTEKTERFVEELVGLFDLTGWGDMQESMRADLEARDPAGLAREFGRAEELLRGLESTAEESLGLGASLVFGEAREHARRVCEQHAERG